VARPIIEVLADLRQEITRIRTRNSTELKSIPYQNCPMRERRAERLREIMDELRSLNEWKKP
jgi:hypothetical protein